mgnify:CR=1 FL=1
MKISRICIDNFKSIKHLEMDEIDNACILVGKNNTGKTVALDAILIAAGMYDIRPENFIESGRNVEIGITLEFDEEDMLIMHRNGVVSKYKKLLGSLTLKVVDL